MEISLPCMPGDTVFAFFDDAPKKKRTKYDASECIVSDILFSKDYEEPLFTVICYKKADYARFWLSEFGTEVFTAEQWFALPRGK